MAYSNRIFPRDCLIYSILRDCLISTAKRDNLGRYDYHYSSILDHNSKTGHIQFVSSIQDVSSRMFSLDEFVVLVRELGVDSSPVINQLLSGTGLVCVPAENSHEFDNLLRFPAVHLIASGSLTASLENALADEELTTKEKSEIVSKIDEIIGNMSALRDSVKEYGNG